MVPPIKALTFDVFGTVVDWRTSIARDGAAFAAERGITHVDWTEFADEFRAGYEPMMARVRRGELPFQPIDALHRRILDDELLPRFGLQGLGETERDHLNRVWHRLRGWPDARTGLLRLRQSFTIASLSNGNVALLTNMAKHADLRWDCVLSAELSQHYKPDPEVYLTAARLLGETACRHRTRSSRHPAAANWGRGVLDTGLEPEQVMMVAAHNFDLAAARAVGFRTAFVARPREFGDRQASSTPGETDTATDLAADPECDFAATDFHDLARQLEGAGVARGEWQPQPRGKLGKL